MPPALRAVGERLDVGARRHRSLEPHIHDAPSVATKVIEADESVEVIHDDGAHHFRFRKPQIDGNAAAAVLTWGECAPIGYAAAVRTKMKTQRPASPGIDPRRARYSDPFVFVVIGP